MLVKWNSMNLEFTFRALCVYVLNVIVFEKLKVHSLHKWCGIQFHNLFAKYLSVFIGNIFTIRNTTWWIQNGNAVRILKWLFLTAAPNRGEEKLGKIHQIYSNESLERKNGFAYINHEMNHRVSLRIMMPHHTSDLSSRFKIFYWIFLAFITLVDYLDDFSKKNHVLCRNWAYQMNRKFSVKINYMDKSTWYFHIFRSFSSSSWCYIISLWINSCKQFEKLIETRWNKFARWIQ